MNGGLNPPIWGRHVDIGPELKVADLTAKELETISSKHSRPALVPICRQVFSDPLRGPF